MVKSPIKIIDSGTAPTTENLGEGQIAFGTVDGATKLYGSDGTTISELGGGGGSEVNSIAPLTTETPPLATGPYSISIGDRAKSTAQSSVSFGPSAVASGTASLSIGFRSNSSSPDTTAIGSFASASDSGSLSIGTRSSSTSSSVSVGTGSESSNQGTAIGYGANATSTYLNSGSTSIGASASAPGLSAVAVGYGSESSADMAAAIGYNSSAAGLRSVAIGSDSAATSTDEFSIGSDSLQRRITHVADPTSDQDAATKKYVDTKVSEIPAGPQGDPGEPGPKGDPGPAGTTTFAGLTDQPTDNAALKTALDAKADQTAVDSLTATVNGKVSSVSAGKGVSITGSATAPVVNGMIAVPDYKNAQSISVPEEGWVAPDNGVIFRVFANNSVVSASLLRLSIAAAGGPQDFTYVAEVDKSAGVSTSMPVVVPVAKGDTIFFSATGAVSAQFTPYKFVEIS